MIESAEEFVSLRNSKIKAKYDRTAQEEASLEVWQELVSNYPDMREWVAHNKTVPLEILVVLSSDPDKAVRWVVATKRKLSKELQIKLAQDPDEGVRNRIAWNAKAYKESLELLINDSSDSTKQKAVERLNSSEYR